METRRKSLRRLRHFKRLRMVLFESFVYNPATFQTQYCRAMLGRAGGAGRRILALLRTTRSCTARWVLGIGKGSPSAHFSLSPKNWQLGRIAGVGGCREGASELPTCPIS